MARTILMSVACLLLIGLANAGDSSPSTFEGQYFYNFENAYFTPKGVTECWALKGDMSPAELPGEKGHAPWGTADVVIRGVLSATGHFGNLGACRRLLTVLEIVEVRNKVRR